MTKFTDQLWQEEGCPLPSKKPWIGDHRNKFHAEIYQFAAVTVREFRWWKLNPPFPKVSKSQLDVRLQTSIDDHFEWMPRSVAVELREQGVLITKGEQEPTIDDYTEWCKEKAKEVVRLYRLWVANTHHLPLDGGNRAMGKEINTWSTNFKNLKFLIENLPRERVRA